jgi:hypothetical protein
VPSTAQYWKIGGIQVNNKPILKQILADHRNLWDNPQTRPVVRENFQKVLDCRTGALGADVYASSSGERLIVPYTCKSPACSSCGQRATRDWQQGIVSDLPEIPYVGVLFTMHKDLWEIFRENWHLLGGLPAIAADVLQNWADRRHGARVLIIAVLHTFGRRLNFYPHVHLVVSSVGLDRSGNNLIWDVAWNFYYVQEELMKRWRHGVVDYLLAALDHGLISSARPQSEFRTLFEKQRNLWWKAGVRECRSKRALVEYISRYLRRPPFAQHKLLLYDGERVRFWYIDTKSKQRVVQECSTDEFIDRLADQVPDRYRHGVHYFGLLAPRCKGRGYEVFLALLRQKRRKRPRRIRWRKLIWLTFRRDPLLTSNGEVMQKIGWKAPEKPKAKAGQILRR